MTILRNSDTILPSSKKSFRLKGSLELALGPIVWVWEYRRVMKDYFMVFTLLGCGG